jgi:TP901 family phage tail tape measure protein
LSADGLQASLGKIGKGVAIGAAVVGIGTVIDQLGKAADKAGEFEKALNSLQAVSGATEKQMKSLSGLALKLGKDTSLPATSAMDAAEAMTELSKAGLSVKDTLGAAKGVLQLAAAATIGNGEAAKIAARALNMFGLKGKQAGLVADVLANAANKSSGEINDMALALQQAGTGAKKAGLSIQETAAMIAILANKGIVGSDAGTSLKTMLARLVPQTKAAQKAMQSLGISLTDANGNMVKPPKLLEDMRLALDKLSPFARQKVLYKIFGSDAIRAATILTDEGGAGIAKMTKAMSEQGAAAKVAAAKMKGYKGAIEALKSNWETLQIEVGMKVIPALTKAIVGLNKAFTFLEDNSATVGKVLSVAFEVATAPIMRFGKAVGDVTGIFKSLVAGIKALVAGDWGRAWDEFSKVPGKAIDLIRNMFLTLPSGLASSASKFGGQIIDEIVSGISGAAGAISAALGNALGTIGSLPGTVLSAARTIGGKILDAIGEGLSGTVGGLAGLPGKLLDAISGISVGAGSEVYNAAKGIGGKVLGAIGDGLAGAVSGVGSIGGKIVNALSGVGNAGTEVWNAAKDVGGRVLSAIGAGLSGAVSGVGSLAGKLVDLLGGIGVAGSTVWNAAKGVGSRILGAIGDGLGGAVGGLGNLGGKLVEGLNKVTGVGGAVLKLLKEGVGSIENQVVGLGSKLGGWIKQGLSSVGDLISGAFSAAVNKAIGILNAAIKAFNAIPGVPNIPTIPTIGGGGGGSPSQGAVNAPDNDPRKLSVVTSSPNPEPIIVGSPGNQVAIIPGFGRIPEFARGGIVTSKTFAMVGESGPEAVIPLRNGRVPGMGGVTINLSTGNVYGPGGINELARQLETVVQRATSRNG